MYVSTLRMVMGMRGLNQTDIAEIAGVSRQAVSLWLSSPSDFQNVQILHLMKLSGALNVSIDSLARPVPLLSDPETRKTLFTEFCWDRLYPDIDAFFIALSDRQVPALARLVERRGLHEAAALLGETIWKDYEKYRGSIHPARRKECDYLWKLHRGLIAA